MPELLDSKAKHQISNRNNQQTSSESERQESLILLKEVIWNRRVESDRVLQQQVELTRQR